MKSAAAAAGNAAAGVNLPRQPDECGKVEDIPEVKLKVDLRVTLDQTQAALERESRSKARCFRFNENVRTEFTK